MEQKQNKMTDEEMKIPYLSEDPEDRKLQDEFTAFVKETVQKAREEYLAKTPEERKAALEDVPDFVKQAVAKMRESFQEKAESQES